MYGFTEEENELKCQRKKWLCTDWQWTVMTTTATWIHALALSSKVLQSSLCTLTCLITIDAKFPEDIYVRTQKYWKSPLLRANYNTCCSVLSGHPVRGQLSPWLGGDSSEVEDSYAALTTSSVLSCLRRRRVRSHTGQSGSKMGESKYESLTQLDGSSKRNAVWAYRSHNTWLCERNTSVSPTSLYPSSLHTKPCWIPCTWGKKSLNS